MQDEPIQGDGVRLRPYREDDVPDLIAACNDPQTQRFLPALPRPYTADDARQWITTGTADAFARGGAAYAVADPGTDRLIGSVGLHRVDPERGQGEIGYWVAPWARRRGVATATVRALSDDRFAAGTGRIEVITEPENVGSQRVAIAAGFRREGVRRGNRPLADGGRGDDIAWVRLAGDPPGPCPRLLPDLPGGELTDGVVTLRPLTGDDIAFYTELHSVPDVVATSVPPVQRSVAELTRQCRWATAQWLAGERVDLVIADAATSTPTGEISLYFAEPPIGQGMIGYSMLPAWRGHGYATRAAQLLTLWTFAETSVARLVAGALPTNLASQRVLTKAGFRREAYQRSRLPGVDGARSDDVQFALLAGDLVSEVTRAAVR